MGVSIPEILRTLQPARSLRARKTASFLRGNNGAGVSYSKLRKSRRTLSQSAMCRKANPAPTTLIKGALSVIAAGVPFIPKTAFIQEPERVRCVMGG